jgi:RHS repeat-associated protein
VGDSTRQKFTGHERDNESGLDFMQARYLNSQQGRFVSADTVAGSITAPQTMNLYAYVANNPLRYVDPTGHSLSDIGVLQTEDPEDAKIAEHESLRDLQLSVNREAGDRWEKLTGIHSAASVTVQGGVTGWTEDSTMIIIWEGARNPAGHVSYITMQNDMSWSWEYC